MLNYNKVRERIKEYRYCCIIAPEQWKAMLQDKYGITQNLCSKKYKKDEFCLYAESETVFDKHGNVSKSSRTLFNTHLQTELNYRNVYDMHCRLEQWNITIEQNKATLQFPQSVLIQPANMVFSYNEYGDLASASDGEIESTFEYKYDENGNWTTRYQIANGKCVEIIVRQLKYSEAEETVAESDLKDEIANDVELEGINEVEPEDANDSDDVDELDDFTDGDIEENEIEEEPQEESTEEPLDSSDNIIGKKVTHAKYGVGEIISHENLGEKQYVSVSFASGIKRFIYPDAFEQGYLDWL